MKRFVILAVMATAFILFASCKKENEETANGGNGTKMKEKFLYETIFQNQPNGSMEMNQFSEYLLQLDVKQIFIADVSKNEVSLHVKHGNLFVNEINVDFSDEDYRLILKDDILMLQNPKDDFYVYKNLVTNEHFLYYKKEHYSFSEILKWNVRVDEDDEIQLLMSCMLLNEFADVPIEDINNEPLKQYEGTGIGFYTNMSDAQYYCERGHRRILENNQGWWSTGISYSCLWGQHLCVCSANFYS